MDELTESARQYLVSQAIVAGGFSMLISLALSFIGILVTTKDNDILRFISLYQLAILEAACGMSSLLAVLYVWWISCGYRNRQIIVRSKYLDEKMSKGLFFLILPLLLTFAAFIVSAIFLMIKAESNSTYELRSAMLLYGTDFTRKIIIDKVQSTLKCCGSQAIEDWFGIDWKNQDLPKNIGNETGYQTWDYNWDSVPFSCCCVEAPPPCIHHHLKTLGADSVYMTGCAEKLDEAVFIFVLLAVVLFFFSTALMVTLLYSARKFQTSARSAIIKGDATAPGAWWLLTPPGYCCPGNTKSDSVPLLPKCDNSQRSTNCTKKPQDDKIKKLQTSPALFIQKSHTCQSDGEESSEDWPGRACELQCSTAKSSYMTTTVTNNAFLGSRQSVSDTAVAQVDMTYHFDPQSRPLYRS